MDLARVTRMFWACAALVLGACVFAAPPSEAAVELHGAVPTKYDYRLKWTGRQRVLAGSGSIRIVNRGPGATDRVWLRLRPNGDERLQTISHLRGAVVSDYRARNSIVLLKLPTPLAPGQSSRFSFRFRLRVGVENTSLGRSAGVNLFGDALPVVAVAGPRGVRIGPEPDYGEGSFNVVADWKVNLTLPFEESTSLPGQVVYGTATGSDVYTASATARVRDFAFAIGKLWEINRRVGNVKIEVAGSDSVRSQLPAAMRRTVNAFKKMQRWYGGYNQPSLRVVIGDLPFGGSEYPGLVFSTSDNATIAHEVAHQWFYGLVGNDQYNDPFLDESLTAFAEQQFHKSYRCNLARPINGLHGLGTGMSYWKKHAKAYEDTIYRGGACALTALERDIGGAAFRQALHAYVASNTDKIADVDDFLAAINNAAPWYDLARWEKLVGLG